MSNIRPTGDRILVRRDAAERMTASGLHLPEQSQAVPQQGTVVAVGEGAWAERPQDGRVPLEVAVGDTVIFSGYGGTELQLDDELLILNSRDVLAVIDDA